MPAKRMITFQGRTMSMSDWARKYNLSLASLHRRLARGMSMYDAIFAPNKRYKRYTINGREYTRAQILKITGITDGALTSRLKRKWKPDELLCKRLVNQKITFKGKSLTRNEWAKELGISVYTLNGRFKLGWPLESILTSSAEPLPNPRIRLITVNGETMNVTQWARRLGITPIGIFDRLKRGWPEEEAVTLPVGTKRIVRPQSRKSHA